MTNALDELKSEGSTALMRQKARAKLERPRVSALPRYGLVGLATAAVIFVAYPRLTATSAWAQALSNSSSAGRVHYIVKDSDGNVRTEEWAFGKKHAWILNRRNQLFCEWRSDGIRLFDYVDSFPIGGKTTNPNQRRFATLASLKNLHFDESYQVGGHLDQLIQLRNGSILHQESVTTKAGAAEKYRIRLRQPGDEDPNGNEYFVVVDSKTNLIVEMSATNGKWTATYDYPAEIDDKIFEPTPQVTRGVEVFDLDSQNEVIRGTMVKGLGSSNGVNLKLVALDASGNIWAFWTGSPVSGRMERGFRVSGIELGTPFGIQRFTTSAAKDAYAKAPDGRRLYGMGRTAMTKVGDTIDITVPSGTGSATFRNVSVMRITTPGRYSFWIK